MSPTQERTPFPKGHVKIGSVEPFLPWICDMKIDMNEQLHAMVVGRAGSGKSKLLEARFIEGFNKGETVGIVEPHHDLSFDTITFLISQGIFNDEKTFQELVYLDFGNGAFVPLNILAGDKSDFHTIALNALDAMTRVWPDLNEAPMFQTLFLSAVTALILNDMPITFLHKIITDEEYRFTCLKVVKDETVLDTFTWYGSLRPSEQAVQAGSLIRRAHLLAFNPIARYSLSQPECLDFRRMMDEGISFIINLGNIKDDQTRKILGAMVMVLIEHAALSRTDLLPEERRPVTVLVDEWTSFAAQEKTISTVLSQCRKFNLRIWLANQSLSQVPTHRLIGAMENCRLTVVFGVGRNSAEIEAKQIGNVDPLAVKEEGLTETKHAQYLSIMEQYEMWTQELTNLDPRIAYYKLHNKPAVKFKTKNVPSPRVDHKELHRVLDTYKRLYQRTEEQISELGKKKPSIQILRYDETTNSFDGFSTPLEPEQIDS